jgi:Asp-tRNA(Asn)/Glu-tRNA(Gln) amidotransferase B subunit
MTKSLSSSLLKSSKQIHKKELTSKQLKELIFEIVASKQKHDLSQL